LVDKTLAAFVLTTLCLVAVVVLMVAGAVSSDVGVPIITLAVGAAIGYLFPSPGQA